MKKLIVIGLAITALALAAAAMSSGGTGDAAIHVHPQATASATPQELAPMLADARLATAKYATSLKRAKRDGYRIIVTQHIPDMGHHFLNPNITGFDITKPPILVYVNRGRKWQLVAFEWVSRRRLPPRRYPARSTDPSRPHATTSTAPSCRPRPRPTARRGAP